VRRFLNEGGRKWRKYLPEDPNDKWLDYHLSTKGPAVVSLHVPASQGDEFQFMFSRTGDLDLVDIGLFFPRVSDLRFEGSGIGRQLVVTSENGESFTLSPSALEVSCGSMGICLADLLGTGAPALLDRKARQIQKRNQQPSANQA